MRNDVSFEKTRAFKSKPKLFYEKFFYFVSIALGSLHYDNASVVFYLVMPKCDSPYLLFV